MKTMRVLCVLALAAGCVDNPVGVLEPGVAVSFGVMPSDQCKNGQWESLGFESQGQCVRYVQTGQDSRDDPCRLNLDVDHFATSEWDRSSPAVTIESGMVVVRPDGVYGDGPSIPCAMPVPWQVSVRARIVSGGRNYVFPTLFARFVNGWHFSATSLPDGQFGWHLQACDAFDWPVDAIIPNRTGPSNECTENAYNDDGPPSVEEGEYMTLRVVVDGATLRLFAKPDGAEDFVLAHEVPYSADGQALERLAIVQPWDAYFEITDIEVGHPE